LYKSTFIIGCTLLAAQWLGHCAATWQVTGSIPDGVIEIFH
jgi:hypothetical protein